MTENQISKIILDCSFNIHTQLGPGLFESVVEDKVIIELKSVESLQAVHKKQLLTYLKLSDIKLGLLINFNENLLKNGINRVVNGL